MIVRPSFANKIRITNLSNNVAWLDPPNRLHVAHHRAVPVPFRVEVVALLTMDISNIALVEVLRLCNA